MDIQSETKPDSLRQIRPIKMQKEKYINSFRLSAKCGREMGKCGVFIPSHSHQHQAIPIPIPMKVA